MQSVIFSIPLILIYSVLFGITMKIADLLDEHGLRWFKGSKIIFGFLWGIFGALLILSNPIIANVYLALVIAFILRYRIDYFNHGIAATIMILVFLATSIIIWNTFIIFFTIFAIFGLMHDYFEDIRKPKNKLLKILKKLIDYRSHYYIFPLIYSVYTGFWLVFFVVGLNMFFYELTIKVGMKIVKKQKKKR